MGDYDQATVFFTAALQLDPNSQKASYNRGTAWAHKGEYEKAISDLGKAIKLDPKNAKAYSAFF